MKLLIAAIILASSLSYAEVNMINPTINLECKSAAQITKGCSGSLVIDSALLTVSGEVYELTLNYEACFHRNTKIDKGRSEIVALDANNLTIELSPEYRSELGGEFFAVYPVDISNIEINRETGVGEISYYETLISNPSIVSKSKVEVTCTPSK